MKVGKAACQKTILFNFLVLDIENWPYNALLGQPFLNKTKAVTATYTIIMNFPTKYGVDVVKGSQRVNCSIYKYRENKKGHQVYMILSVE